MRAVRKKQLHQDFRDLDPEQALNARVEALHEHLELVERAVSRKHSGSRPTRYGTARTRSRESHGAQPLLSVEGVIRPTPWVGTTPGPVATQTVLEVAEGIGNPAHVIAGFAGPRARVNPRRGSGAKPP